MYFIYKTTAVRDGRVERNGRTIDRSWLAGWLVAWLLYCAAAAIVGRRCSALRSSQPVIVVCVPWFRVKIFTL